SAPSTLQQRTHSSSDPAPASTIQPSRVRKPPYGANVGECVPRSPGTDPEANVAAASVPRLESANSSSDDDTCVPIPVRSRSACAASRPTAQLSPAPTSSTGAPTLTGPEASLPVTLITPLLACRIRSKPPRPASGP